MLDVDARQYPDGWAFTITLTVKGVTEVLHRSPTFYPSRITALMEGGGHLVTRMRELLQERA